MSHNIEPIQQNITNVVAGNFYRFDETFALPDVPKILQETVAKAWLTLKADRNATDVMADLSKEITPTELANVGWVKETGINGTVRLVFDLTSTDTKTLTPELTYFYDVKFVTTGGKPYTPQYGRITFLPAITLKES